jgi:hypothetical protein
MNDPIRNIYFDTRMETYNDYVPADWASRAFQAASPSPALDQLLLDLILAWRTTAYTASMPTIMIRSVQASTLAYAGFVSPDSSIISFADGVLARLSRNVPELANNAELRTRLTAEIKKIASEFRLARATLSPQMPIEPIWNDFLCHEPFAMSVWSSQRVSYVAFYNAYEAFLVHCVKHILGRTDLRTTHRQFKQALRSSFSTDILTACWTHPNLNVARLVRHSLSHAGGRETADLKTHPHKIKVIDGVLQIVPGDNHNLLDGLRNAVDMMVESAAVHPRFASGVSRARLTD